jgi:hypothetical protein
MPGPLPVAPETTRTPIEPLDSFSRSADRAYHALTILAILLVLGSLWVF